MKPPTITWDAKKDFLEKYRALMEQVNHGGHDAYYQVKELLGPGFHSHNKIHKTDKIYTRKKKHKGGW